jgi:hypothetical protein
MLNVVSGMVDSFKGLDNLVFQDSSRLTTKDTMASSRSFFAGFGKDSLDSLNQCAI